MLTHSAPLHGLIAAASLGPGAAAEQAKARPPSLCSLDRWGLPLRLTATTTRDQLTSGAPGQPGRCAAAATAAACRAPHSSLPHCLQAPHLLNTLQYVQTSVQRPAALSAPPFFPHCLLPVCGSLASSFEGWLGGILRSCTSQVALHSEGGHNGLLTVSHINQPWSELRCAALVLKTACLLLLPGAPMPRASRPDVWQARAAPRLGDSAALASDHPLHHEAVELHTASRAVRSAALARESRCRSCRRHSPPVWHAAPPLVQPAPHRLPHLCTHTGTHGPSSCGALRSALPPAGLPVRVRRLPCTAACSSAGCSHEQLGGRRPAASGRASGGRRLGAQPAAGCDAGA